MEGERTGSDLLSRDLTSHYHRRACVSLPGSGLDRVGPQGCDHRTSERARGARAAHVRGSESQVHRNGRGSGFGRGEV